MASDGRDRRDCPNCGSGSVVSRREADAVFREDTVVGGAVAAEPTLAYICTNCYRWRS